MKLSLFKVFETIVLNTLASDFFSTEVMTLLMRSQRLEDDGFGFASAKRPAYNYARGRLEETWWFKFPSQYKKQYLRQKVQQHPARQCVFTTFVQELVDLPHEPRTVEEEEVLIEKLIDAWLCGKFTCVRNVLDHRQYAWQMERYRGFFYEPYVSYGKLHAETLDIALATSAIKNRDCVELQAIIDRRGADLLIRYSNQFGGIRPLDIAAKRGSADIIKVLTKNGCEIKYWSDYYITNALSVAARSGNKDALSVWIEDLKSNKKNLAAELDGAVTSAMKIGNFEMAKFIEQESGVKFETSKVLFELFIDAIMSGKLDTIQEFIDRGGFDINMRTEHRPHGALFASISEIPNPKVEVVTLLLTNGANPNVVHRRSKLTPVQVAVKKGYIDLVKLLVAHGADIRKPVFKPHNKTGMPLLYLAVQRRSTSMIRFLLAQGLERNFTWKKRNYSVKGDPPEGYDSGVYLAVQGDKHIASKYEGYVVIIE